MSLNEIDLIENGIDEKEVRIKLGTAILDYAADYYSNYEVYSHRTNRTGHNPYILKALIMDDPEIIGDILQCQNGRN